MEAKNSQNIDTVLHQELKARKLSHRQVDRALKAQGLKTVAHKMPEPKVSTITFGNYDDIVEVTGMDGKACLALATGADVPISALLAQLQTRDEPRWRRGQKKTLAAIRERRLRGTEGFGLFRAELRRIEVLREDDPEAAELLAWQALEQASVAGNAGGTAGALGVLAGGYPRAKAHPLFTLAFEILGDKPRGLVAGKVFSSLGRFLITLGYAEQAEAILKHRALPEIVLSGSGDEKALTAMNLARAAAMIGDLDLRHACLELAVATGGDRLRFLALQKLAFTALNAGNQLNHAAALYDELFTSSQFDRLSKPDQCRLKCSRMTARFLAGQLAVADITEFEDVVSEGKALLTPTEQIQAAMDLALCLRSFGKNQRAREVLEAELWNALGLEETESEIRSKYLAACSAVGPNLDSRFGILRSR